MPYTIKIPSAGTSAEPKPYTVYNVVLDTPLRTQTLKKRYSDFTDLHSKLTSTTGVPPASLPAKSWFTRTVNNPELTEERRKGLEAYLLAIESSPDPKWRHDAAYRGFLGFAAAAAPGEGRRRTALEEEALEDQQKPVMSSQQWLDLHNDLKNNIHSARLALTKRDQATSATLQHEASAQAKKWLVKAHTLILRLEEGLRGLSDGKGAEKLGDGEVRRRRDLLSRARKEREGLEGVLNSFVTRSSAGRASPDYTSASKSKPTANDSSASSSLRSVPGAFPTTGGGRRVLGGPPAKETERTRELDNAGVLQLQQQIMKEQDLDVADLSTVVRRMREMGVTINEELADQAELLGMLDQDVERVGGKIQIASKRVKKIN